MNIAALLRVALRALRVNALRSALAMLGVIIGVGSVIIMVSISAGAKRQVEEQIASLGSNMLTIRPGSARNFGRAGGAGTSKPLSDADAEAILNEIPGVVGASGSVSGAAPVIFEGANWSTSINGVGEQYFEVRDWGVVEGRTFTVSEVRGSSKVAILGRTVVEELFGGGPVIGAQIRIRNVPFEVIGIMEEKGESTFGRDQDDIVFMPVTTARDRLLGGDQVVRDAVQTIYVEAAAGEEMEIVAAEIEDLLRVRRGMRPGAEDDFAVRNFAEFIRARNETEAQLGLLLAWTGAISLIVGGIGIMNIMLVSVTERTREIGLRMAVGARGSDVRNQFLLEAVVLCVIGGILGLGLGTAGTMAIAAGGEFPVMISPVMVAIAIGSSAAVGVAFGFYPARRASKLNPIEALRFE